jgi:hypothetical protein
MNPWSDLQKWFVSNCDGEWEYDFGIKIETMSDPGWLVIIDLDETNLEGKEFSPVKQEPCEDSWIDCRVEDSKYRGMGDSSRLEEILRIFVDWAKSQNEDWLKPPEPMSDEGRQKYEDEQFFASLGDEVESEPCQHEGCIQNRIRNSMICRQHHFEMVKKRPAPKRAT